MRHKKIIIILFCSLFILLPIHYYLSTLYPKDLKFDTSIEFDKKFEKEALRYIAKNENSQHGSPSIGNLSFCLDEPVSERTQDEKLTLQLGDQEFPVAVSYKFNCVLLNLNLKDKDGQSIIKEILSNFGSQFLAVNNKNMDRIWFWRFDNYCIVMTTFWPECQVHMENIKGMSSKDVLSVFKKSMSDFYQADLRKRSYSPSF